MSEPSSEFTAGRFTGRASEDVHLQDGKFRETSTWVFGVQGVWEMWVLAYLMLILRKLAKVISMLRHCFNHFNQLQQQTFHWNNLTFFFPSMKDDSIKHKHKIMNPH